MERFRPSESSRVQTVFYSLVATDGTGAPALRPWSRFLLPAVPRVNLFLSRAALGLLLVLLASTAARADSLNLGVLSYDPFIPGAVDAFTVNNSTGPFSLPPDFLASTSLTFSGATLDLTQSGVTSSIPLGDLAPGISQLLVLDSASFSSAVFNAQLSQTLFALSNGTSFQANSSTLTATLLPSSGPFLTPGVDFVLLTVSGTVVVPVPEPPSWLLFVGAAPWLILFRGMIRKRHS